MSQRFMKNSVLLMVLICMNACAGNKLLPKGKREVAHSFDHKLGKSAAYKKAKLWIAKSVKKDAFTLDDAQQGTLVVQLSMSCNAFPSADGEWVLTASWTVNVSDHSIEHTFEDILLDHPSFHKQKNAGEALGGLFMGEPRRPRSAEELTRIDEVCLRPLIEDMAE